MKRLEQFYLFLFLRDFLFKHLKRPHIEKNRLIQYPCHFFLHSLSFLFKAGEKAGGTARAFLAEFSSEKILICGMPGWYCYALQ